MFNLGEGMEREPPARAPPSAGSSLSSALRVVASVGIPTVLVIVIFMIALAPEEEELWCPHELFVQLSSEDKGDGEWEVIVSAVSYRQSWIKFDIRVLKNGTVVAIMDFGETIMGSMTFTDLDFDGALTAGDYYTVQCDPGSSYEFVMTNLDCTLQIEKWKT